MKIIIGNDNPTKDWTQANYTFWHSPNEYTIYEYTFKKSYNKLSGKLRVKSHYLLISQDKWYDFECKTSQYEFIRLLEYFNGLCSIYEK